MKGTILQFPIAYSVAFNFSHFVYNARFVYMVMNDGHTLRLARSLFKDSIESMAASELYAVFYANQKAAKITKK